MSDEVNAAEPVKTITKAPRSLQLYEELKVEEARLEAILVPAREIYEKKVNDPELIKARQVIKETQAQLAPIKNELAVLARAGGARGLKAEPGVYKKEK